MVNFTMITNAEVITPAAVKLLLPPFSNKTYHINVVILCSALALVAALLFIRLPPNYHIPVFSRADLLLALVGLCGGGLVLDLFFISPYFWNFIPRRV